MAAMAPQFLLVSINGFPGTDARHQAAPLTAQVTAQFVHCHEMAAKRTKTIAATKRRVHLNRTDSHRSVELTIAVTLPSKVSPYCSYADYGRRKEEKRCLDDGAKMTDETVVTELMPFYEWPWGAAGLMCALIEANDMRDGSFEIDSRRNAIYHFEIFIVQERSEADSQSLPSVHWTHNDQMRKVDIVQRHRVEMSRERLQ